MLPPGSGSCLGDAMWLRGAWITSPLQAGTHPTYLPPVWERGRGNTELFHLSSPPVGEKQQPLAFLSDVPRMQGGSCTLPERHTLAPGEQSWVQQGPVQTCRCGLAGWLLSSG